MYTSPMTGEGYVQELLHHGTHPDRIHDVLGVCKHVFRVLMCELHKYSGLRSIKHVSAEEQLAIFLHLAWTG